MSLDEFEDALENIEETLLDMELCGRIIEYYDNSLSEYDRESYKKNVRYIRICYESYKKIEEDCKLDENNTKLSPELLSEIDKSLEGITDKEQIAFKIYYELSKNLIYSSKYIMAETEPDILAEMYKDPMDIDSKDREVVCITWVRIYASLLNKYGIDAIATSKTGLHHSVLFKVGPMIFTADATEMKYSEKSDTYMNDLTRIKLGIAPRSLKNRYYSTILDDDDYRGYICETFASLGINLKDDKFEYQAYERLNKIYSSGGENFYDVFDIDPNDETSKSVKKMKIIDTLIRNCDLTNTELMQYVNNLSDMLFLSDKFVEDVTIIDNIKKKISKIFMIGETRIGYKYFLVEEGGVRLISKEEITELFDKGEYVLNTKRVQQSERKDYSMNNWRDHIAGFKLKEQENEGEREE